VEAKPLLWRSVGVFALVATAAPFCEPPKVEADCGPCNAGLCFHTASYKCAETDMPPYCFTYPGTSCS
jgi:hypothetical protein